MKLPKADMYQCTLDHSSKIICCVHKLKKNYTTKLHWHDFFELEIVLEGNGLHTLNGEQYEIFPGSAFLLSYKDFHLIHTLSDLTIYNISFTYDAIHAEFINRLSSTDNLMCMLNAKDFEVFHYQMAFAEKVKNQSNAFYRILLKDNLENLLIKMVLNGCKEKSSFPTIIQKSILEINSQFRNPISLESVAKKLFLTPNYFGTLFKDSVGCSFRNYLNAIRIRCACNMLVTTDKSIKEIADDCGYNSVEYFSYAFKKAMHVSATAYRAKMQLT